MLFHNALCEADRDIRMAAPAFNNLLEASRPSLALTGNDDRASRRIRHKNGIFHSF
jgi:hypothetical protein